MECTPIHSGGESNVGQLDGAPQWQAKYRWHQAFEFGAQGFGDMGRWNHFDPTSEQSHRMGPAIFGKYNLGGGQAIVWNAALLFGLTDAQRGHSPWDGPAASCVNCAFAAAMPVTAPNVWIPP